MSRAPVVSAVLPTYNRLPLLVAAIESVLAQTFESWELIVVDDGSTDATRSFVANVTDPRVRVVCREHTGRPSVLRNLGICEARGQYIAFLDSDDVWMPHKLERQLLEMERDRIAAWSYTDTILIDKSGNELPKERFKKWEPRSGYIFEKLLPHDAMVACPTVMATRALLDRVGGFDETLSYCEDYELWLRLAKASRVVAVPERLTKIRLHPGNNTRDRPEVNAAFAHIYEQALRGAVSRQERRLCRQQCAFYRGVFADQLAARGAFQEGVSQLMSAMRYRPLSRRVWRKLIKHMLRRVHLLT